MRKKHILLALFLTFPGAAMFAQNATPQVSVVYTDGIAVLQPYDPAAPSFITDMNGNFVFTRTDAKGNSTGTLWKYDPASVQWVNANGSSPTPGKLLRVAGTTNTSVVDLGSSVEAVYWKDASSGTFWCLSAPDAQVVAPSSLNKLWEGKNNEALETKDRQGNPVWSNKLSVGLYYK